jgi:5-methylcytosine-specific restriction endonuclease McrA
MRDQQAINEKIRRALKGKPHPHVGVKHTSESKALIAQRSRTANHKTLTDEERRAKNKANVYAYRARKYGAILPTSDLALIRRIYMGCPSGYQVDHIVALAEGGPHHQDNLQYLPTLENQRKGKNREYNKSLAVRWQDSIPQ